MTERRVEVTERRVDVTERRVEVTETTTASRGREKSKLYIKSEDGETREQGHSRQRLYDNSRTTS